MALFHSSRCNRNPSHFLHGEMMGGNMDIDYANFCDEQERENDMGYSRSDLLAYHHTMSALEKEMAKPEFDEKPHPLDYTEFELAKSATELLTLTSRAYVMQKLRDLANEFAVLS